MKDDPQFKVHGIPLTLSNDHSVSDVSFNEFKAMMKIVTFIHTLVELKTAEL